MYRLVTDTKADLIFKIVDGDISKFRVFKTQLGCIFDEYNTAATSAGSLTNELQKEIVRLSNGSLDLQHYLESLDGSASASLKGYIASLIDANAETVSLKISSMALNAALKIGFTVAVSAIALAISNYAASVREARQEAVSAADEAKTLNDSLSELANRYKELYEASSGKWNEDTLKSVRDVQSQIVDLVGDQAGGIDLVNGKLQDQLAILRDISVETAKNYIQEHKAQISSAKDFFQNDQSQYFSIPGYGGYGADKTRNNAAAKWFEENISRFGFYETWDAQGGSRKITGTIDEIIDSYREMYDALERYGEEQVGRQAEQVDDALNYISNQIAALKGSTYDENRSIYEGWLQNEAIVSQADVLKNGFADQAAFDEYISGLRNATDGNKELRDAMIEVVKNAFPEFVQATSSAANGVEKQASGIDYLIERYKTYGSVTIFRKLINASETLQSVLDGMKPPEALEFLSDFLSDGNMGSAKDFTSYFDAVDEISKLQKQLTDAQKEMLDSGTISAGTATDVYTALTAAGENYLDYLTIEGDQIKLNTEAYKEFIRQQVYEKNGVADLSRALAEELALREQYTVAMREASASGGLDKARSIQKQLQALEAEYGTVEELQNAIKQLEAIFNAAWDENGLKSGTEGLGAALEATETKAAELENAIRSLKQAGNLDELTQTDFSNLLTQFPKLKRWLDAYSKGQITATRLLGIFQNALDQFNAGGVFDDLATAKDSISALGKVVNDLSEGEGVSFSALSSIQEAFSGVDGIEDYIQYLKEAKTNTEEVSNIIGTLMYQSLIEAAGSTQDLANADEALITSLLKEAGVADAAAAAHQAVERAKQDSAIASKVAAAATTDDITAIYNECIALGMTKDAIYQVVATQIIFSNTKMDVSQKIAALNLLSQTCGVAIGAVSGVSDAVAGLGGVSAEGVSGLAAHYLKTNRAATKQQAEQMALNAIYSNKMKASNPFKGVDFSSLGSSSSGGGGGTAKTKAEEIKSAFDDLNTTMEHSIYLEQQYYNVADSEYDYDGMKQALQNQVGYYKQIQAAAESAMEQVRAYYRSKGMSDAVIEQQSEIQALQKAWWEAANSIDESLDKIATAIRDKLSKEVDDIQNAWSSLQKAAEEYSSTGVISIDSLQAIISAGVEYVSLLKDENGQLVLNEDAVSAVLEAKTQQLAVESALSYVEQVRNALMQNNVTELNRLLDVTSVTASSTWDLVYAQAALLNLNGNQYNQLINNINKFRSIATTTVKTIRKQVRNSVQNETKDYKSALDDVLKLVEDLIKYEHEQMVDALEDQRDAYQALIDKKKELLQQTKDEEDYESNVSKKLKEISRIQDQINRLSLDDSREAAAKRASLEEELADLQESLADYIGDYTSGKNEETLDKAAEDYSQYIDERIKKVEDEVSSEEKIYRLA